jgi:hypothetical protein
MPHFCACPKTGCRFPSTNVMVFLCSMICTVLISMELLIINFRRIRFISIWDNDEVHFIIDQQHALLYFYCASSLIQQSAGRHVLHSATLSWLWDNQSLHFLLNAICLAEKQLIPILVFGLTRPRLEPTISCAGGKHANHYTINAVQK